MSDVTFAGYLLELPEHANLMAVVQMQKVRPEKTVGLTTECRATFEEVFNLQMARRLGSQIEQVFLRSINPKSTGAPAEPSSH